jgi:O-6-methylguanine DNA methyltransferase
MKAARQLQRDLRALGRVLAPAGVSRGALARLGLGAAYTTLDTVIGQLFVAYDRGGVVAVRRGPDPRAFEADFRKRFGRAIHRAPAPPAWLARALASPASARALRVDLGTRSPFERAVLAKAREIPAGEVRSYAWVAREIGHPAAVRAVGSALGKNPVPLLIPCHRVVRSDGTVSDFIFGPGAKRALLRHEGVDPDALARLGREGVRYLGSDTTRIYCFPTCRAARRITAPHRVPFRSPRQAAKAGYRPCRLCRPALLRPA